MHDEYYIFIKALILEDFLKTCEKIATAFHIAKANF